MDANDHTKQDLEDALNGTGKFASPMFPTTQVGITSIDELLSGVPTGSLLHLMIGMPPNPKTMLGFPKLQTREEREAEGWRELEKLSGMKLTN